MNKRQNPQLESSEDSSFCFSEYRLIWIVKEYFWETTTFTDFRRISFFHVPSNMILKQRFVLLQSVINITHYNR
jgi:hypothetical protein